MHAGLDWKLQTEPFKRSSQTHNMFPPYPTDEQQKQLQFCMSATSSTSNNVQEEQEQQEQQFQNSMFIPDLMRPPSLSSTTLEGLGIWDTSMVQESDGMNSNKVLTSSMNEASFVMGEGSGSGNLLAQFQFNGFGDLVDSSSHMRAPNLGVGVDGGMELYQTYTYPPMLGVNETESGNGNGNGNGNGIQFNILNPTAETERTNTAHRKLRRMIKNRESAARSRARRQAYDTQLQYENEALKEENEMLRKVIRELSNLVRYEKAKKGLVRSFSGPF